MGAETSGGPATAAQRIEVAGVCDAVVRWARTVPSVVAVGLAGSWARDAARADSDVDVVVLTDDVPAFVEGDGWVVPALGEAAPIVRTQQWGVLTERRVRLASGLEVELGFISRVWAVEPVDAGTLRVVTDGFRVLHDPHGVLARLVAVILDESESESESESAPPGGG
ncbi:nucleotidyltransferase domain-containing protein [Sanguibacter suaedae]|uniref:Aminoglycoside 6-adenylyltransferase n=1 Tax=Sanguibacter suaedae TaxID=2795737 RepID=A0A934I188_9MICO|nr:nucleotidyltransferase domain-containing protein [Sanguibacter suaedae]MBI9113719.1 aminoglycoside 6-adenylyltransferase [Sanguibacter suaedae]